MATVLTREEYIRQRRDNDIRMHNNKVKEREALKQVNTHYEDLLRDNEQEFRRKRDELRAERDAKKEEIMDMYKDERRQIWEEDNDLVTRWRSQLNTEFTPPIYGDGQHKVGG